MTRKIGLIPPRIDLDPLAAQMSLQAQTQVAILRVLLRQRTKTPTESNG